MLSEISNFESEQMSLENFEYICKNCNQ